MNLFFDLDGTLVDPFEGITNSVRHALESQGMTAPAAEDLTWMIGPPLIESFAKLGAPDPVAALDAYRARYATKGLAEHTPYPGVLEVLSRLKEAGHVLHLMTAKPHVYARKITAQFGISPFLTTEYGPELDGTFNDKAELLAHALAELGIVADNALMIGDRIHDFRAAHKNGLRAIAALWGYGPASETDIADMVCASPQDLPAMIATL